MGTGTGAQTKQDRLFFKLCSDHVSIEAIPRKTTKIDLAQLKDRAIAGHKTILWTPHFVVLRNEEGNEITLRRDGRMIIRKVTSEQVAKRAADEVMRVVYVLN